MFCTTKQNFGCDQTRPQPSKSIPLKKFRMVVKNMFCSKQDFGCVLLGWLWLSKSTTRPTHSIWKSSGWLWSFGCSTRHSLSNKLCWSVLFFNHIVKTYSIYFTMVVTRLWIHFVAPPSWIEICNFISYPRCYILLHPLNNPQCKYVRTFSTRTNWSNYLG